MGRGCLLWLMLFAAVVAALRHFLAPLYDPPATWIVPLVAGLFTMFGLGALWGGRLAWRDLKTLRRAIAGAPRIDGHPAAAFGRVEPEGEPLFTPFGQHACVCYEYEMRRPTGSTTASAPMDAGLGGFRAEPYVVRSSQKAMRVFGVPDFTEQPELPAIGWECYVRARAHLAHTPFKQMHGANVAGLYRTLMEAWADDDGSVDLHWQRVADGGEWLNAPKVTEWLVKSAEQAALLEQPATASPTAKNDAYADDVNDADDEEDEEDDDELDEGDVIETAFETAPDLPRLVEKFLPVGQEVCLFGVYSAAHDALTPSMQRHAVMLRVMRGHPEQVLSRLRAKVRGQIIGGLFLLALVAGALTLGTTLYRLSPKTKQNHAAALSRAVRQGDAAALKDLLGRTELEELTLADPPLLMQARDPEMVRLLLDRGVNPNRASSSGETPLMQAAASGQAEIVRLLIAAGADLNAVDPRYGSTALIRALDAERDETAQILREAGASDETVDERNGTAIDPSNSPTVAACVRYIEAIHAADAVVLKRLSAATRKADFDDVDYEEWRSVRPVDDVHASGYAHDTAATITITGPCPGGYPVTWVFQMANEAGEWKVLRERWLTRAIREATGN